MKENETPKNKNSAKGLLLFILALAFISWGVYQCKYYYSKWSDYGDRPWAYNRDENAKLLIGRWEGSFKDPDNVSKNIKLEIFEPTTEKEREAKASRKSRRRSGIPTKNKTGFDGIANVTSRLGTEEYEIYGSVEKDDFHKLKFSFRPIDEAKRVLPNFTMSEGRTGRWQDDQLTITFAFSFQKADGSSFYSSADPRHEKTATVTLSRSR
ncbi:hypothetical protein SAMN04487995_0775 [Dyadobacter koreensis]|uniref:SMODS-associating 2TM beta-strand rich effector domain-containing protein n=1 Tax=Dyadobacter koreensis TaxID=408657 RepID=A0A1H6QTS9_9BACT|nr:hypothetical protein [Dyadobacter koreensis]SEI44334.1 hypothetical protein SAMN04487995_0775 [Dyadobacter koreensis]